MTQELQLPKEVLDRVDALAAKVGTTIERLWPALVRWELGQAWAAIGVWLLLVTLTATLLRYATKQHAIEAAAYQKAHDSTFDLMNCSARVVIPFVAGGIGFFSSIIVTLANAAPVIGTLVSPEAAALRALLGK